MIVMVLERVTPSLRGELTRWLIQPKTGVFVGRVSARVRDLLWEKIASAKKGRGRLAHLPGRDGTGLLHPHRRPNQQDH